MKNIYYVFIVFISILVTPFESKANIKFDVNGRVVSQKQKKTSNRNIYFKRTKRIKRTKRTKRFFKSKVGRTHLVRWKNHRMPASVANKLKEVERKFGKVTILSSCRPGAVVKKSGRPSMHRYCRAVDFNPPRGKYRQVANFLKSTWRGGVGTYSGRHHHIHIDDNRGRWHN